MPLATVTTPARRFVWLVGADRNLKYKGSSNIVMVSIESVAV